MRKIFQLFTSILKHLKMKLFKSSDPNRTPNLPKSSKLKHFFSTSHHQFLDTFWNNTSQIIGFICRVLKNHEPNFFSFQFMAIILGVQEWYSWSFSHPPHGFRGPERTQNIQSIFDLWKNSVVCYVVFRQGWIQASVLKRGKKKKTFNKRNVH